MTDTVEAAAEPDKSNSVLDHFRALRFKLPSMYDHRSVKGDVDAYTNTDGLDIVLRMHKADRGTPTASMEPDRGAVRVWLSARERNGDPVYTSIQHAISDTDLLSKAVAWYVSTVRRLQEQRVEAAAEPPTKHAPRNARDQLIDLLVKHGRRSVDVHGTTLYLGLYTQKAPPIVVEFDASMNSLRFTRIVYDAGTYRLCSGSSQNVIAELPDHGVTPESLAKWAVQHTYSYARKHGWLSGTAQAAAEPTNVLAAAELMKQALDQVWRKYVITEIGSDPEPIKMHTYVDNHEKTTLVGLALEYISRHSPERGWRRFDSAFVRVRSGGYVLDSADAFNYGLLRAPLTHTLAETLPVAKAMLVKVAELKSRVSGFGSRYALVKRPASATAAAEPPVFSGSSGLAELCAKAAAKKPGFIVGPFLVAQSEVPGAPALLLILHASPNPYESFRLERDGGTNRCRLRTAYRTIIGYSDPDKQRTASDLLRWAVTEALGHARKHNWRVEAAAEPAASPDTDLVVLVSLIHAKYFSSAPQGNPRAAITSGPAWNSRVVARSGDCTVRCWSPLLLAVECVKPDGLRVRRVFTLFSRSGSSDHLWFKQISDTGRFADILSDTSDGFFGLPIPTDRRDQAAAVFRSYVTECVRLTREAKPNTLDTMINLRAYVDAAGGKVEHGPVRLMRNTNVALGVYVQFRKPTGNWTSPANIGSTPGGALAVGLPQRIAHLQAGRGPEAILQDLEALWANENHTAQAAAEPTPHARDDKHIVEDIAVHGTTVMALQGAIQDVREIWEAPITARAGDCTVRVVVAPHMVAGFGVAVERMQQGFRFRRLFWAFANDEDPGVQIRQITRCQQQQGIRNPTHARGFFRVDIDRTSPIVGTLRNVTHKCVQLVLADSPSATDTLDNLLEAIDGAGGALEHGSVRLERNPSNRALAQVRYRLPNGDYTNPESIGTRDANTLAFATPNRIRTIAAGTPPERILDEIAAAWARERGTAEAAAEPQVKDKIKGVFEQLRQSLPTQMDDKGYRHATNDVVAWRYVDLVQFSYRGHGPVATMILFRETDGYAVEIRTGDLTSDPSTEIRHAVSPGDLLKQAVAWYKHTFPGKVQAAAEPAAGTASILMHKLGNMSRIPVGTREVVPHLFIMHEVRPYLNDDILEMRMTMCLSTEAHVTSPSSRAYFDVISTIRLRNARLVLDRVEFENSSPYVENDRPGVDVTNMPIQGIVAAVVKHAAVYAKKWLPELLHEYTGTDERFEHVRAQHPVTAAVHAATEHTGDAARRLLQQLREVPYTVGEQRRLICPHLFLFAAHIAVRGIPGSAGAVVHVTLGLSSEAQRISSSAQLWFEVLVRVSLVGSRAVLDRLRFEPDGPDIQKDVQVEVTKLNVGNVLRLAQTQAAGFARAHLPELLATYTTNDRRFDAVHAQLPVTAAAEPPTSGNLSDQFQALMRRFRDEQRIRIPGSRNPRENYVQAHPIPGLSLQHGSLTISIQDTRYLVRYFPTGFVHITAERPIGTTYLRIEHSASSQELLQRLLTFAVRDSQGKS